MKILDTDTCIAILRGVGHVIERRAAEPDDVATTWVTAAELYFGAAKSAAPERNRPLVDKFLTCGSSKPDPRRTMPDIHEEHGQSTAATGGGSALPRWPHAVCYHPLWGQ